MSEKHHRDLDAADKIARAHYGIKTDNQYDRLVCGYQRYTKRRVDALASAIRAAIVAGRRRGK